MIPPQLRQALCGILLVSSTPSTREVEAHQRWTEDLLAARKIEYQRVDGAQADQRELRNALFACSGKKAVYPQLFAVKDGAHSYVGDYAALHSANEQDTLDALLSPLTTAS